MATTRTRLVTYAPAPLADLLRETAGLLDLSASQLLLDLLQASTPVLEALRDAATALQDLRTDHVQVLDNLAATMRPLIAQANDHIADLSADQPPLTYRGVTP